MWWLIDWLRMLSWINNRFFYVSSIDWFLLLVWWLIDSLITSLIILSFVHWLILWLMDWFLLSVGWLIDYLITWLIILRLVDWLILWLMDCFFYQIGWLVDWFFTYLIDWYFSAFGWWIDSLMHNWLMFINSYRFLSYFLSIKW